MMPESCRICGTSPASSWTRPRATSTLGSIWVAIDHWNTEHPHVHILVRGRADDGKDLVISRDYISTGFRARAGDLVTRELGPRSELETRQGLEAETTAERWTAKYPGDPLQSAKVPQLYTAIRSINSELVA